LCPARAQDGSPSADGQRPRKAPRRLPLLPRARRSMPPATRKPSTNSRSTLPFGWGTGIIFRWDPTGGSGEGTCRENSSKHPQGNLLSSPAWATSLPCTGFCAGRACHAKPNSDRGSDSGPGSGPTGYDLGRGKAAGPPDSQGFCRSEPRSLDGRSRCARLQKG